MNEFKPTERTKVRRLPDRGKYDSESVYGILDEAFICHVGFVVEGQPYVIPTGFARVNDTLYIHGSAASRMLRTLADGVQVCVTVTLVDGIVMARSGFHSSMNYRSVVILGRATQVEGRDEKLAALVAFSEQVMPGRWKDLRETTDAELKGTLVLTLPLKEVSAKVRTGSPKDDEVDYALPLWAGVVPLKLTAGNPINDPRLPQGIEPPGYARNYKR
jgi:nitroimidazol reductase NimA-like FMN-containing flavoprotein (pyridoxamine 5'-phosphate oxidase superfamily)